MGWKAFKEYYGIEHLVHVVDDCICIGSTYCPDLLKVYRNGRVEAMAVGETLETLRKRIEEDPWKAIDLINAKDKFKNQITVWTWEGDQIIARHCEELGWPNVTHCGKIMHDNKYFRNKLDAIQNAKKDAEIAVEILGNRCKKLVEELAECQNMLLEGTENYWAFEEMEKKCLS